MGIFQDAANFSEEFQDEYQGPEGRVDWWSVATKGPVVGVVGAVEGEENPNTQPGPNNGDESYDPPTPDGAAGQLKLYAALAGGFLLFILSLWGLDSIASIVGE